MSSVHLKKHVRSTQPGHQPVHKLPEKRMGFGSRCITFQHTANKQM
jgi:hypothetical protein